MFDTHTHYDFEEFDDDRLELFEKFRNKLSGIVNVGINCESIEKVIEYAKMYPFMYFSVGIHPMEVEKNIPIEHLENILKREKDNPKLVGIGETGLDYHFDYPKDLQEKYFIEQIYLANQYNLPIIIHARESHEDLIKILKNNPVQKGGIMHCYSGTPAMAQDFIDMGYYLGIGGYVTRKKDMQETVKMAPIDKLVLETDSPFLVPFPLEKPSRNNSLYLNYIIEKIAEIKGLSEEEVVEKTTQNAKKIYEITN